MNPAFMPYKNPVLIEQKDDQFVLVNIPRNSLRTYFTGESIISEGKTTMVFHEDISKAKLMNKKDAEKMKRIADGKFVDILSKLSRPRPLGKI